MTLLLLAACGPMPVEIDIEPASLDFGELPFTAEMPDEGYGQHDVRFTNVGDNPVTLTLQEWDVDHLCLPGFSAEDLPKKLAEIGTDGYYVVTVQICDDLPGEDGSLVETALDLATNGDPAVVTVPISFTPVRVTN